MWNKDISQKKKRILGEFIVSRPALNEMLKFQNSPKVKRQVNEEKIVFSTNSIGTTTHQ